VALSVGPGRTAPAALTCGARAGAVVAGGRGGGTRMKNWGGRSL
jgi:hypothetical protein